MKNIIENAFIEILSGIAQFHNDGGIITEDEHNNKVIICFPTKNPNQAVVKGYHENGQLKSWG